MFRIRDSILDRIDPDISLPRDLERIGSEMREHSLKELVVAEKLVEVAV